MPQTPAGQSAWQSRWWVREFERRCCRITQISIVTTGFEVRFQNPLSLRLRSLVTVSLLKELWCEIPAVERGILTG